ncbi:unnamed protein product [Prunus brigantina]
MNLKECEMICMNICSCTVISNLDIRDGGRGCLLTQYKDHSDQYCVVYWTADPGPNPAIISKVPCYIIYFTTYFTGELNPGQKEDLELPLFDLAAVVCATKNFSNNNKLGEGGFRSVFKVKSNIVLPTVSLTVSACHLGRDYGYKSYIERLRTKEYGFWSSYVANGFQGTLKDGQEIAVKRLSKHSTQGLNELKNEAWMLYTEGRSIEVLDTLVGDFSDPHEVVRSIHVGLSSVQRNPADRPSMPAAVVMLSGEGSLPQPQKPGFYSEGISMNWKSILLLKHFQLMQSQSFYTNGGSINNISCWCVNLVLLKSV